MSRSGYIRTVGSLLLGSGAQLTINVGVALLATLWLPIGERGLMVILMTVASVVALIGAGGIGNVYRSRYPAAQDRAMLSGDFSTTGVALALFAAVLGAAGVLFMSLTDSSLATPSAIACVALAAATQVGVLLVTEARFALGHFAAGARWAATSAGLGAVGAVVAMLLWQSAAAVVTAQAALQLCGVVIAVVAATRVRALIWTRPDWRRSSSLIRAGLGSIVLPLSIVAISRVDRLVVGAFDSADAVAVYALAATVVEVARLVPTAVGQTVLRDVAAGIDWRALRRKLMAPLVATLLLTLVATGLLALLTVPLFGKEYAQAPLLALILSASEVSYVLIVILNLAIIGGGWSALGRRAGGSILAITIVGYVAGGVLGGSIGVAIARVVVFSIAALLLAVIVRAELRR